MMGKFIDEPADEPSSSSSSPADIVNSRDEPTQKQAKLRRFKILPVLRADLLETSVPLVDANILRVPEKRLITKLITILPKLSPELGHLKRIFNGHVLINIMDGIDGNGIDEQLRVEIKNLLEEEPDIFTSKVPSQKPRTRAQFEASKRHWPIAFHKDSALEAKLDGSCFGENELDRISKLFIAVEAKNAALFFDANREQVICEGNAMPEKPLYHPVMRCIQILAENAINSGADADEQQQYLATGFDAILAQEPCTMCAMALVHARVRRVFFGQPNPKNGALLSTWRLQESPTINHHFEVFQIVEIL